MIMKKMDICSLFSFWKGDIWYLLIWQYAFQLYLFAGETHLNLVQSLLNPSW